MNHDDWRIFLACLQIDLKRQLLTLDTLAAETELIEGPPLWDLAHEEREAEIRRRHGEDAKPRRVLKGWR